ncbi:hypothetical protein [Acidovorax sp. BL-A-41-H1]|uniref:hypothetical protein n=1 Tax=Acidovorax sp. BL-A-41-H1 TaxID=3421102 RepID=UPI003F79C57A
MTPNWWQKLLRWPGRMLAGPASGLLALVIVFEEWGWEPLQHLLARIGRWPGLRWVEGWVRSLPPWAAVAVFALPTALLLPVKLLALWAIGHGHVVLGMAIIVLAKLVGTAVVARLFTLTQPALMQLPWFAALYAGWTRAKHAVLERARATWAWRVARVLRRQWVRIWRRRTR